MIPVVPRHVQQFAIGTDQTEVDAPCIDGHPINFVDRLRPAPYALTDFMEKPESVPVQARWELNRDVRKSMELLKFNSSFGDLSQYGPPALCAQIKRQIMP